ISTDKDINKINYKNSMKAGRCKCNMAMTMRINIGPAIKRACSETWDLRMANRLFMREKTLRSWRGSQGKVRGAQLSIVGLLVTYPLPGSNYGADKPRLEPQLQQHTALREFHGPIQHDDRGLGLREELPV